MSSGSGGRRVTAFILALVFLVSTIGATAYVIWQLNREETGIGLAEQEQDDEGAPKLKGTSLTNFTPLSEALAELKIEDISVGTGVEAKAGDTISVAYTGAIANNGVIFESSLDTGAPATFALESGSLIDGWVQGIPGMKEGGKRRLTIPAALAYGDSEKGDIPANSDLVFDIELQAVIPPEATEQTTDESQ